MRQLLTEEYSKYFYKLPTLFFYILGPMRLVIYCFNIFNFYHFASTVLPTTFVQRKQSRNFSEILSPKLLRRACSSRACSSQASYFVFLFASTGSRTLTEKKGLRPSSERTTKPLLFFNLFPGNRVHEMTI